MFGHVSFSPFHFFLYLHVFYFELCVLLCVFFPKNKNKNRFTQHSIVPFSVPLTHNAHNTRSRETNKQTIRRLLSQKMCVCAIRFHRLCSSVCVYCFILQSHLYYFFCNKKEKWRERERKSAATAFKRREIRYKYKI